MTVPYDLTRSRVLITGGGGFLGRHLRARLVARGVPESAIAAPSRAERDLLRLEECRAACAGRDVVFHVAARVGGIAFNLDPTWRGWVGVRRRYITAITVPAKGHDRWHAACRFASAAIRERTRTHEPYGCCTRRRGLPRKPFVRSAY